MYGSFIICINVYEACLLHTGDCKLKLSNTGNCDFNSKTIRRLHVDLSSHLLGPHMHILQSLAAGHFLNICSVTIVFHRECELSFKLDYLYINPRGVCMFYG